MTRILFVCLGNICRSPMAEFILRDLAEQAGRSGEFVIGSAATSAEELGNPVYPPAREELAKHGISCAGKRAVQLRKSDYDRYDLLIGMDDNNIRNMMGILGSDPDHKVHKLLEYTGRDGNVADPWYSERFDIAYRDIDAGCRALLAWLDTRG